MLVCQLNQIQSEIHQRHCTGSSRMTASHGVHTFYPPMSSSQRETGGGPYWQLSVTFWWVCNLLPSCSTHAGLRRMVWVSDSMFMKLHAIMHDWTMVVHEVMTHGFTGSRKGSDNMPALCCTWSSSKLVGRTRSQGRALKDPCGTVPHYWACMLQLVDNTKVTTH